MAVAVAVIAKRATHEGDEDRGAGGKKRVLDGSSVCHISFMKPTPLNTANEKGDPVNQE